MAKGGIRNGSGRPHGSGKYGEKTVSIRVPLTLEPHVKRLLDNYVRHGFSVKVYNETLKVCKIIKKVA